MNDIIQFIIGKILGRSYVCDRCQEQGHNYMTIGLKEFLKNKNKNGRYCEWCWNWINLKKWKCKCGNSGTLRSAHQYSYIACNNCYNVNKLWV